MPLSEAVRRVAGVLEKPLFLLSLPVWVHFVFGWILERCMKVPLISLAQVHILSEGVRGRGVPEGSLPDDLVPRTRFDEEQIRRGLPMRGPFGLDDFKTPCGLLRGA